MIFFIGIFLQAHEEAPILLRESRLIKRLPQHNTQVIYLDTDWPKINHRSRKYPISGVRPENLAYVIPLHNLHAPESGVYFEQLAWALNGELNGEAFEIAWWRPIER